MSAVPKPKLTPQEYLAIERQATFKSEYHKGEMFAMAGASYPHNRIKDNLARHLGNQLENHNCFVLTSDTRVLVSETGLYTYPDIVVVCGEAQFEDDLFDTLVNPKVIVEVLSESTEGYDRGVKFRQYQQIESLSEYILITQEEPVCERLVRQADGSWILTTFRGLDAEFRLASVPVGIPMSAIYAGVTFPVSPPPEIPNTERRPH